MLKPALSALILAVLPPLAHARASPVAELPAWTVPNPDALPDDSFGRTVRRGRDLILRTSSLIGPDAAEPAMRYAVSGLDCESCHIASGTRRFALPLAGIWGIFPQYIGRENEVRTLAERINGCMTRSLNGKPLPVDGREMKAMLTYIRFVSAGERTGQPLDGRGAPPLPLPSGAADPVHGGAVFASMCAECHGAGGQGKRLPAAVARMSGRRYQFPPLWGPDSFNDGAGMNRAITAARFVHANMPFGTTFEAPALSVSDAFDVAAYVVSQPRPHMAGLDADYPDRMRKPVDAGYLPFVGPFPPEQHRLGPWQPIQEWIKINGGVARAGD